MLNKVDNSDNLRREIKYIVREEDKGTSRS